MTKQTRLSIFLIKDGVTLEGAIDPERIANVGEKKSLSSSLPYQGVIWIGKPQYTQPSWLSFADALAGPFETKLLNSFCSCVIGIDTGKRRFLLPFGQGHHWISDDKIEHNFGLRVVLNAIDEAHIKGMEREEFEAVKFRSRTQASATSRIDDFGVDQFRHLVRSVAGICADKSFANSIAGANSLAIRSEVDELSLASRCDEALGLFSKKDYIDKGFSFIDNFSQVTDPIRIASLDTILLDEITQKSEPSAYLTGPGLIDDVEHVGFFYPGRAKKGEEAHLDLRIGEYVQRAAAAGPLSLERLKSEKIRHITSKDTQGKKYRVYDLILFEVNQGGRLFVLTQGDWFEISQDHVKNVEALLAQVPDSMTAFPNAKPNEVEPDYNKRIGGISSLGFVVMDAIPIHYGGGKSKIELCDFLTKNRQLIHVKRGTRSSKLSHLFSQCVVAAETLMDPTFRAKSKAYLPDTIKTIFDGDFNATEWSVVVAIISTSQGDIRKQLPFFSRQTLAYAAERLRRLGYSVYLKKIAVT